MGSATPKKKKKRLSYKEYVALYGEDAEGKHREALTLADTAYAASGARYGTRGASLAAKGLTHSGYSDYLDGVAYAERSAERLAAQKERRVSEEKNDSLYSAYLLAEEEKERAEEKEAETRLSDAFSSLLSEGILDEESAKKYLLGLGIDEASATALAEKNTVVQRGTATRRNAVLSYVLNAGMTYSRALDYALANGLSSELSREIALIAKRARDAYYTDNYRFPSNKY